MGTTPIRLQDSASGGDFREMSTSEENFLAYQAGLQLAAMDSDDVSAITTISTGNHTIGTFTDTVFDQAVGTHGVTLTTTSTNTTLYQTEGLADSSGSDLRTALEFDIQGAYEIHEMTNGEMDTLTDRLVSTAMTNEYPGTYRLGSSSPSGDYDTHLASVFSDTRTDGNTVAYNIYQRQTMTAPAGFQPLSVKRSSGRTGTFQGIQEMTNDQIKYTFGQRAKSRIMAGSNGVGTYQLRSSAQGAPVAAGTWAARGTATDTRNTTGEQSYTRNSTDNFSRDFIGDYTGDFLGNYARDFIGNYSRDFVGNYTGN